MKTGINEAMTSGVLIEFLDAEGNLAAQQVFADWRGSPLPAVGDALVTNATCTTSGVLRQIRGTVSERYFDVQRDLQGQPCVWVRLVVRSGSPRHRHPISFSLN